MNAGGPHCYCTKPHRNARRKEYHMKETNMTETISRIEEGLIAISLNPERSFVAILEEMKVPYYNILTSFLAQRGVLEKVGTRLRWVGDPPTRTLAGLIYEQCRSAGVGGRPNKGKAKASKARIAHAAIYGNDLPEEAKEILKASDVPLFPVLPNLQKALALMEKAILAGVKDPVAFVENCLKDPRI